jgi:hypothetical protein
MKRMQKQPSELAEFHNADPLWAGFIQAHGLTVQGGDGVEDANMIRQVASDLAVAKCPKDVGQTELNEGLLELGN